MADVRDAIDEIDRALVPLLARRSRYVARAATLKPARSMVVDPARIEDVVTKAKAVAAENGMDQTLIERIYRSMVDAFIAFETTEWDHSHKS
jgi:isochorismate pyruvate lyase